jgi:hypothetical protein
MRYLTQGFKAQLSNALTTIQETYDSINNGGCGIFAKIVEKQLTKRGFNVEYVFLFRSKHCVNSANENARCNDVYGLYCTSWCHVLLRVNGYYVDSSGVHKSEDDLKTKGDWHYEYVVGDPIPKDFMMEFLSNDNRNNWNSCFDRRQSGAIALRFNNLLK